MQALLWSSTGTKLATVNFRRGNSFRLAAGKLFLSRQHRGKHDVRDFLYRSEWRPCARSILFLGKPECQRAARRRLRRRACIRTAQELCFLRALGTTAIIGWMWCLIPQRLRPATSQSSFWSKSATPLLPEVSNTASITLGLKFYSDVAGTITGVRFYKGPHNTGTHIGNLWSSTGTKLASVKFSGRNGFGLAAG